MNRTHNYFWKIRKSRPYHNMTKEYYKELHDVHPNLPRLFEQGDNLIKNKNILCKRVLEEESINIRANINIIIYYWLESNPGSLRVYDIKCVYHNLMGELRLFNRE